MIDHKDTVKRPIKLILDKLEEIHDTLSSLGEERLSDLAGEKGTFFGMTDDNIYDLYNEYCIRGGDKEMTSESIRKAFRPDKIRVKLFLIKVCGASFKVITVFPKRCDTINEVFKYTVEQAYDCFLWEECVYAIVKNHNDKHGYFKTDKTKEDIEIKFQWLITEPSTK